jgi:hypothetical protein
MKRYFFQVAIIVAIFLSPKLWGQEEAVILQGPRPAWTLAQLDELVSGLASDRIKILEKAKAQLLERPEFFPMVIFYAANNLGRGLAALHTLSIVLPEEGYRCEAYRAYLWKLVSSYRQKWLLQSMDLTVSGLRTKRDQDRKRGEEQIEVTRDEFIDSLVEAPGRPAVKEWVKSIAEMARKVLLDKATPKDVKHLSAPIFHVPNLSESSTKTYRLLLQDFYTLMIVVELLGDKISENQLLAPLYTEELKSRSAYRQRFWPRLVLMLADPELHEFTWPYLDYLITHGHYSTEFILDQFNKNASYLDPVQAERARVIRVFLTTMDMVVKRSLQAYGDAYNECILIMERRSVLPSTLHELQESGATESLALLRHSPTIPEARSLYYLRDPIVWGSSDPLAIALQENAIASLLGEERYRELLISENQMKPSDSIPTSYPGFSLISEVYVEHDTQILLALGAATVEDVIKYFRVTEQGYEALANLADQSTVIDPSREGLFRINQAYGRTVMTRFRAVSGISERFGLR